VPTGYSDRSDVSAASAGGESTGNFAQSLHNVRQERSDTGNSSIASASALTSVLSGLCSVDKYGELSEKNLALNNRLSSPMVLCSRQHRWETLVR
jgi:hypothetical protein